MAAGEQTGDGGGRAARGRGDWGGLRSALSWAWVAALGLVATGAALILLLSGATLWDPERRLFNRINRAWGRALCRTLRFTVELRGAELARGPAVIIPNHQSVVDLLVLYLLPLPYRTVVKASWFKTPVGLAIRLAGYIPAPGPGHLDAGRALLGRARGWLDRGVSVLLFPEGTRSRDGRLGRFRRGAFALAADSRAPLLPVAIAGTDDVAHPSSWRFAYGRHVIVEVLPPIAAAGREPAEVRQEARQAIEEAVDRLRAELRDR